MNHRPRLTAGQYAASFRESSPAILPSLKTALAAGPVSLDGLVTATGHSFPLVASAIRSKPGLFSERDGLVYLANS
jgi:hypothetical protein